MAHQYIGTVPRIYLAIVIPGKGSLVATPGHQHEFDGEPPNDGLWVLVEEPPEKAPKVKKDEGK